MALYIHCSLTFNQLNRQGRKDRPGSNLRMASGPIQCLKAKMEHSKMCPGRRKYGVPCNTSYDGVMVVVIRMGQYRIDGVIPCDAVPQYDVLCI